MAPVARTAALAALTVAAAAGAPVDEGAKLDVILYGATGCVGGLSARHLAAQAGLRWAVAGRNASSVKALAQELCSDPSTKSCPEPIAAPLDSEHDLTSMVTRTKAVASAAGPFSVHGGEWLLAACARNGVHYVDTSDEFYWQRAMLDKYGSQAAASGASLVLSSGFCAVVGDLGAQLALSALPNASISLAPSAPAPAGRVDAWLETYNGGVSRGVLDTTKAMKNASFPKEWTDDPYLLSPDIDEKLKVDSSITGIGSVAWDLHEGAVTQNLFGPYDARILRLSFAKLGQAVHLRAGATPTMYTKWSAFLAARPGSWSSLATCPTENILKEGSWRMRVRASGEGKRAKAVKGSDLVLSGSGDPGYHFTAVSLAEAALCLSGQTAGCRRTDAAGGVQSPMAALHPVALKERLESIGLLRVEEHGRRGEVMGEAVGSDTDMVVI